MALREKLTERAQAFLEPGERVQVAVPTQRLSPWLQALFVYSLFVSPYRAIVVTDRRILVLRSSWYSATALKRVEAELPRSTQIGPASGTWWRCDSLGERLYVHKRFHGDVAAADARRPTGEAAPARP